MTVEIFELFGVSFLIVNLLMLIFWGVHCVYKNVGIIDIAWGICFAAVSLMCFIFGDGAYGKKIVLVPLVLVWSLRLAWHLWSRFDFNVEDPRYTKIKMSYGKENIEFKMYLMFLFQGLLVVFISTPIIVAAGYSLPQWELIEKIGVGITMIAILGEAIADYQLSQTERGKICQSGLWRYSRHPNYFFEWLVWVGFFLFALPATFGTIAIISPIIIYVLLNKVSGIPTAEAQSLKSKGEAYKEYQRKTSAFFPWFPKS